MLRPVLEEVHAEAGVTSQHAMQPRELGQDTPPEAVRALLPGAHEGVVPRRLGIELHRRGGHHEDLVRALAPSRR